VLGRLSAQVAQILLGKTKPEYTPHHDVGDFVVITNADKIKLTGRKADQKFFQSYSGYPGGQKNHSYKWMIENKPELLLERAVRRMMPRNRLSHQQITKLKVYTSADHPHSAQNPTTITIA
jgi:large subunit ribosomal protein L13